MNIFSLFGTIAAKAKDLLSVPHAVQSRLKDISGSRWFCGSLKSDPDGTKPNSSERPRWLIQNSAIFPPRLILNLMTVAWQNPHLSYSWAFIRLESIFRSLLVRFLSRCLFKRIDNSALVEGIQ